MKRTYFDANAVIYYIEQNPVYLPIMVSKMFTHAGEELVCCVTSDLVRLESRVRPLRDGQLLLLKRFDNFFAANEMHSIPLDRQVFELATQLRAQHRLKTPDALHLAAAIKGECDEFWTNDSRLSTAAKNYLHIVAFESIAS